MSADYASGSSALLAGEISDMRITAFAAVAVALGGCAIQRAQIAQDACVQIVGVADRLSVRSSSQDSPRPTLA